MKHIHILGVCGTFMGSLAVLARQKGFKVTGSDQNIYPPMSTYLESLGIEIIQGYDYDLAALSPDQVVVGNAMTRGKTIVENLLNSKINYTSGPDWLYHNVLKDKKIIAVSGTHGKTTTTSLVVKILEEAGLNPSFLIGGITQDFGVSSRLTDTEYFVIEADEYDTAFFDKRSKFMHYHPDVFIINNLEFDHADIFDSIEDIYRQFHFLIRSLPSNSTIIYPENDENIETLLSRGCWSQKNKIGMQNLTTKSITADYSCFNLIDDNRSLQIQWNMLGEHNAKNALSAYAVAKEIGVLPEVIQSALRKFKGVKRRLECLYKDDFYAVYDDFAHHPTAIKNILKTIQSTVVEKSTHGSKVIAILEARSNTMKKGSQELALIDALSYADEVLFYQGNNMQWHAEPYKNVNFHLFNSVEEILKYCIENYFIRDSFKQFVVMSNGGFEGIHQRLIQAVQKVKCK